MKYVIFAILLLPVPAFADTGIGAFFSWIVELGDSFWTLATDTAPSVIERFFAWVIEWAVMIKAYLFYQSIQFSWSVASVILEDIALGSQLNAALGFLPQDIQAALVQMRILDGVEIIIQAFVARFAMDFVN